MSSWYRIVGWIALTLVASSCARQLTVTPVVKSVQVSESQNGYDLVMEKCVLQQSQNRLVLSDCRYERVALPTETSTHAPGWAAD